MDRRRFLLGLCAGLVLWPGRATGQTWSLEELITLAAEAGGVHPDLLASVIWVESRAWPWALNVRGLGLWPRTRAEAEWVLRQVGDDVDIGYAQISYRHWGRPLRLRKADLLDPWTNLALGAAILRWSMAQAPGWLGVGRYHSSRPWRQVRYAADVARTYQAILRLRASSAQQTAAR